MIMASGDELTLKFNAADLPHLEKGWTRDFLLFVDGWAKDAWILIPRSQTRSNPCRSMR